jgi:hypothetical protein
MLFLPRVTLRLLSFARLARRIPLLEESRRRSLHF